MVVTRDEVRAARVAAGLTQREAAALVHLARTQTWQDWELGQAPADPARYRLFCHLTGLERLPFGAIRSPDKSSERDADELAGKIDRMIAGAPRHQRRPR